MSETKPHTPRRGRRAPLDPERLRNARIDAGIEQKELAERAGASTTHISRLELGQGGVSPEMLSRLAVALNRSIDDLKPAQPETAAR